MTERAESPRIAWIDTAKCIGIYLVILGHLNFDGSPFLTVLIYSFHMPMFFFLSGLVEKRRTFRTVLVRSARTLLGPYVCFYLVTYPWWFVVAFLRHPELYVRTAAEGIVKPLLGLAVGCGFDTRWSHMTNVPLWFLVALFWCRLAGALGERVKIALCVLGTAVSVVLWQYDRFLPFSLGAACMAFPFYYAGSVVQRFCARGGTAPLAVHKKAFCVLIAGALTVLAARLNGRVDVDGIAYGRHPLLFFIGAGTGTAALCALCQLLKPLRGIARLLSENTVTVLAFHSITSGIVMKLYAVLRTSMQGGIQLSPLQGIVIAFFSLLATSVPCAVISRCFPWMLGKR